MYHTHRHTVRAAAVFAVALLAPALSAAQGDSRHVLQWKSADILEVRSTVMTQSSCYVPGRSDASAPLGQEVANEALPLTLPLQHTSHYACIAVPTPVHFLTRLSVPTNRERIAIFLRDGRSGEVRVDEMTLPQRPEMR